MDALVNNATTSFETTTGFELSSVVTWMVTHVLSPILGSGLALFIYLLPWIIALLLISVVVYFGYRAWRGPKA